MSDQVINRLDGCLRHEVLNLLDRQDGATGIELGVAGGGFSKRMVDSGRFAHFFGVDMFADTHDTAQYKEALRTVGLFAPYKLLRMTFDEAYDLFEDESLDFVYIDGYAHSGQEGGDTIWKWARKVRVGGVISGDDYSPDWPLVKAAVDRFVRDAGFQLHVTTVTEPDVAYSDFPSWAVVKTHAFDHDAPQDMVRVGKAEAERVARKRARGKVVDDFVRRHLPSGLSNRLREWNRARKKARKR